MKLDLKAAKAAKNAVGAIKAMKALGWSWEAGAPVDELAPGTAGPPVSGVSGALSVSPSDKVAVGDLLILALSCRGDVTALSIPGWIFVGIAPSGGNTATSRVHVYRRTAQASGNTAELSVTSATAAQIYAFRNAGSAVAGGIAAQGSTTTFFIPGGAVQASSLVLIVVGQRNGSLTRKITSVANPDLSGLVEIGDARTEAGDQAALTVWLGRVPIGVTAIQQTTVTQPVSLRYSGIHINITNS